MSAGKDTFEQRVKDDLKKIVADTPPALRARIDAIAAAAVDEGRRPRRRLMLTLVPLGGVAAALVAVVAFQLVNQPRPPETVAPISPDDVALLLNVDNLDLLEQMEFYLWLDREPGVLDAADAAAPKLPRRS